MATKLNKYGLRPKQLKLMEILSNPENIGKSITDICCLAGINRGTYYKFMADDNFVEIKNKIAMDTLRGKIDQVINAAYKFAISNAKCSNDRKVLLNMAGLYSDKQEIKADIDADQDINVNIKIIE